MSTLQLIDAGTRHEINLALAPNRAALERRNALLEEARSIVKIETEEDAACVRDCMDALARFVKEAKASHRDVKDPVLELGRTIDGILKTLSSDVEAERERLRLAFGAYEDGKRRAAEAARLKAEAEARAAVEAAQKAERERIAAEAAELAKDAGPAAAQVVVAEQTAALDSQVAAAAKVASAMVAAPAKTGTVRYRVDLEITDVTALFRTAPGFVRLEVEESKLKKHLLEQSEAYTLPGIRWRKVPIGY